MLTEDLSRNNKHILLLQPQKRRYTPQNYQFAPENQWLGGEFSLGTSIFRGYLSFKEGIYTPTHASCNSASMRITAALLGRQSSFGEAIEQRKKGPERLFRGFVGDEILPSYVGIVTSHSKDPY